MCSGVDAYGRNVLHLAASCGREDVLEWLLNSCNEVNNSRQLAQTINQPDRESAWTPLHRGFFYGHLEAARTLIKVKINFYVLFRCCIWCSNNFLNHK